jgi:hypothetical protein
MNTIKALLIVAFVSLNFSSPASNTLYVRFNNYYISDGPIDAMVFDQLINQLKVKYHEINYDFV